MVVQPIPPPVAGCKICQQHLDLLKSLPWNVQSAYVQSIYNTVADKLNAQLVKAGEEASVVQLEHTEVRLLLERDILRHMQTWNKIKGEEEE